MPGTSEPGGMAGREPPGGGDTAQALAGELMSVTAGIRRVVRRQIGPAMPARPLPPAQVDLLIVVEKEPGIGVAAAAQALDLAGNSVSALVNQLVSAGLLRRDTDPRDRRAARLNLTPLAARRLHRWREARAQLVADALGRLGPADQVAIGAAVPALRRLLDDLRQGAGSRPARRKDT